jgi:hypothetical protein
MSKIAYSFRLLREFVGFARENRMYWIVPLVLMLAAAAALVATSQAAAPFIYTLF